MSTVTINIIGAGRVGQTLGKLFHDNQCFKIGGIFNKHIINAQKAAHFIGAGEPCLTLEDLPHSDVTMITTPDSEIESVVLLLQKKSLLRSDSFVFHCSGAIPSDILLPLAENKIHIGSIHPFMTFVSPALSIHDLSGAYCFYEGSMTLFQILEKAFTKIKCQIFKIATEKKPIYHAATVMTCNYLVALMDIATELFVDSGLTKSQAFLVMQPIIKKTIDNIFSLDTITALTGPIARGDVNTIQKHMDALENTYAAPAYKTLGLRLIELATKKGDAPPEKLEKIKEIFLSGT